ncbi:MAG: hypothetical protein ACFFB3_24310, partial [Candidatus Hodarchaeota archaeon]
LLKPPKNPSIHVPYRLLTTLMRYAPPDQVETFIFQKIDDYGYFPDEIDWKSIMAIQRVQELPEPLQKIRFRLPLIRNWIEETLSKEETYIDLTNDQRKAIYDLISRLKEIDTADAFQSAIFAACKENNLSPRNLFPILYQIFIGTQKGPKLGPLFALMGSEAVIQKLEAVLGS